MELKPATSPIKSPLEKPWAGLKPKGADRTEWRPAGGKGDEIEQAQFHLPYALAIMIVYGECAPGYFHESYLENEDIKQIIDKVDIIEFEKYTDIFPAQLASRVEIEVVGNNYIEEKMSAPWDYGNHPSKEEIKSKFHKQTSNYEHIDWNWFFKF